MKMQRQGTYTKRISLLTRSKRRIKRTWRNFKRLPWYKKTALVAVPVFVVAVLIPFGFYLYFARDISDMERLMNRNNTGVAIYASDGKTVLYSTGRAAHHELVPLDKISKPMQQALVASEDKDFYKHNGFSFLSTVRAVYTYIVTGGRTYGGSTLTQQLAKITLLSSQRSFLREYQAFSLSIAIENRYSKDQILEMYLNSAYFGGTAFGIQDAAKDYFGTTPDKLTLAQSAMLVGLLPAPNLYSPVAGDPKLAKESQEDVLRKMVNTGVITDAEKESAQNETLRYAKQSQQTNNSIAPHFAQMVLNQLYDKYGEEKVQRSGYQVTTTLNATMQKQLNQAVQDHIGYIDMEGGSNASAIAIDPTNGEVRALVGSADYTNAKWGEVNMATTARQPGSSFKAIYYTQALQDGVITPATILKDEPTDFGGYAPLDADHNWRGNVTVRQAISQSLNVPSVEVMQKLGVSNAVATAKRLGITTLKSGTDYGLSLALGAAEVPLEQMTNAYAAFANGGNQFTPTIVSKIQDKYDKTAFTADESSKSVMSQQASWLIANILSDYNARAPIFGGSLTVSGHKVAVKTGTTDDDRDAWTIGFTPSIAVGVWVGNNDNTVMNSGGSDMAGPIWVQAMSDYLANKPSNEFNEPSGIVQRDVCTGTGALANSSGINTYSEYFISLHLPTKTCNSEQKPVMIKVCRLSDQKMVDINQDDFDSSKYSKNASDCDKKETPTTIQVCRLSDQQIVTINESDYNDTDYSKDLSQCNNSTSNPPTNGNGNGTGNGSGSGNGGTGSPGTGTNP